MQADLAAYRAFDLCRTMGWGPEELAAQPQAWVHQAYIFLSAERSAERTAMEDAQKGRK